MSQSQSLAHDGSVYHFATRGMETCSHPRVPQPMKGSGDRYRYREEDAHRGTHPTLMWIESSSSNSLALAVAIMLTNPGSRKCVLDSMALLSAGRCHGLLSRAPSSLSNDSRFHAPEQEIELVEGDSTPFGETHELSFDHKVVLPRKSLRK